MNIASGQTRAELGIACLSPAVRGYIAELELEIGRLQQRSKAHRQNIRSMQAKLREKNLLYTITQLTHKATTAEEIDRQIHASLDRQRQMRRAAV